jgi:hypothetical protein
LGDHRPLILAGGPKAVDEQWDFLGLSPDGREGADAVVTGEECSPNWFKETDKAC